MARSGNLHPIIRDTRRRLYCGPTAICAVTGLAASRVLSEIDSYRGSDGVNCAGRVKGVRGMSVRELCAIIDRLGFRVISRSAFAGRPTLAAYLHNPRQTPMLARIVRIKGHYLAVGSDGHVCDTKTKQPVPAKQAPDAPSACARGIHHRLTLRAPLPAHDGDPDGLPSHPHERIRLRVRLGRRNHPHAQGRPHPLDSRRGQPCSRDHEPPPAEYTG